jgi:peroxiredoxin
MRVRILILMTLLCVLPRGGLVTHGADEWETLGLHRAPPGIRAPDFTLLDVDGRPVSLAALRGRSVFLNFWASWCAPCEMEMPAIQRLQEHVAGERLVVVAINFRESATQVREFARERGLAFRLALDQDGAVTARYAVERLPFTLVLDPEGHVRAVAEGPRDWSSAAARALVERLARETY